MTDKLYRAVIAANKALDEYKYHIVGGAAGTVSPSKQYLILFLNYVPRTFFSFCLTTFIIVSMLYRCSGMDMARW